LFLACFLIVKRIILENLSFFFGLRLLLIFLFLILLFVLVFSFLGSPISFWRPRWWRRRVTSSRTAGAFLKEEAEDVQQEQNTHAVKVSEESLIIVQWQLVRYYFAYHVSDAHDYKQFRIDEAHDDEERRSEIKKKSKPISFLSRYDEIIAVIL